MTAFDWSPCQPPALPPTRGHYVEVTPLDPERDGDALFAALGGEHNDELWRFIPFGPFETADQLTAALVGVAKALGWLTHLLRNPETEEVLGMASYMRLRPEVGSAEVGGTMYSSKLQRTPAATEAMFFMARHLFDDLGYRRYEWKCDDDNTASKRAAQRLGFTFEGVFRQDLVVKGKNRDTAWFSILDREWPRTKAAFEAWLSPQNITVEGRQRLSRAALREG